MEMKTKSLGRTGPEISALGFGCGSVGGLMVRGDLDEQRRAVAEALEAGVTYFDTAPSYGNGLSESNLGRVLRDLGARDRVVLGTKVRIVPGAENGPAATIRSSLEQSLQRLDCDHVDLVQVHNHLADAPSRARGSLTAAEMLGPVTDELKRLVREGLTRLFGFTGIGEVSAVQNVVTRGTFNTMQCYFNALNASAGYAGASGGDQDFGGLINTAADAGVGVIGIRALAAGALGVEVDRAANAGDPSAIVEGASYERDVERARSLRRLSEELSLEGPAELALRFALAHPHVSTVLVGFSNLSQLREALRWTARGPLPSEAVERIVALAR